MLARRLRQLWRVPAICLWLGVGLVMAIIVLPLHRWRPEQTAVWQQRLMRHWMQGLLMLLPLQITVHGQAAQGTHLLVSNHVSWLDIALIAAHAPVHFLSKAEVRHWPVIGLLAQAAGTLFIQRGAGSGTALQGELGKALGNGHSLVIFAEGTTTLGDRVRAFHGRLLSCAIDTGTPIQPIALRYRSQGQPARQAAFIDDDEFSRHLLSLLGSETLQVELYFLPAQTSTDRNRNQLARETHAAVTQALGLDCKLTEDTPTALLSSAA
ncbi:MAG: 1-acyl-sn-glycerol-3-phosphate acyltransferase [Gammaproteobacteria bacterium HGW-Gammaproteobacteria-11]|nr:MAG: 1-acyl-sn-glycerol-3-phosphate acyltransferase [Gammaproteobacteria bacterium HGW-Gammaproteobacteria-11]